MADGAVFHLDVSTVSRSTGRSAVAAAAYRAGTVLDDARTGLRHDYTRKKNVVSNFIVAPDGCDWISDRQTLWDAAEAAEKRKNSTVAREWLVALPDALPVAQRAELAQALAVELATRFGVAVDVAIHTASQHGNQKNHHAHLLTTTRIAGPDGLGEKTRILDAAKTGGVEIAKMREWWAGTVNDALAAAQSEARVDHRRKAVVAAEKQELAEALEAQAADVATLTAKPAEIGGLWKGLGHAARAFRSSGLAAFFATGVTVEKLKAKAQELRKDVKRLSTPPAVHRGPALNAFVRRREAAEARVRAAEAAEEAKRAEAAKQALADRERAEKGRERAEQQDRARDHYVQYTLPLIQRARKDPELAEILAEHGLDLSKPDRALARDDAWRTSFSRFEDDKWVVNVVTDEVKDLDKRRDHYAIKTTPLVERARKDPKFAARITCWGIDLNRPDAEVARDGIWRMSGKGYEGKLIWSIVSREAEAIDRDREAMRKEQEAERVRQEAAQRLAPSPAPERPKPQAPRPKPESGGGFKP